MKAVYHITQSGNPSWYVEWTFDRWPADVEAAVQRAIADDIPLELIEQGRTKHTLYPPSAFNFQPVSW